MNERRRFRLIDESVRRRALEAVRTAPVGHEVTIAPPRRSLDQNAAQWTILEAFSRQLQWPVNGHMTRLEPEEWKDILTAAFRGERVRLAMGLNGGVVMLGLRTSRMNKREFSEYLEFLHATAAERGVRIYEREEVAA